MHILHISRHRRDFLGERWRKFGITSEFISDEHLLDVLNDALQRDMLIADALVFVIDPVANQPIRPPNDIDAGDALAVALRVRDLPNKVAMPDGRKWNALPIVFLAPSELDLQQIRLAMDAAKGKASEMAAVLFQEESWGATQIAAVIKEYRQHVLAELDDLGFIVAYEGGRYRVKPALKARKELAGHYYLGAADVRPEKFVTVDRDLLGIQLEVELFEALINRADVSEAEFQKFFEDHPHFLSVFATPLPHVRLEDSAGKILVPDFILKPIVAAQRDSRWEVLDLKMPQVQLLVGKGARRRLSQDVMKAISQVREYGNYFGDTRNTDSVERSLGHRLRKPKLGVLIGRLRSSDVEALESQQSYTQDVRLITYDEILEEQKTLRD